MCGDRHPTKASVTFHDLVETTLQRGAGPTPGPRPLINNPHRLSQADTRALGQFRMPTDRLDSQRES